MVSRSLVRIMSRTLLEGARRGPCSRQIALPRAGQPLYSSEIGTTDAAVVREGTDAADVRELIDAADVREPTVLRCAVFLRLILVFELILFIFPVDWFSVFLPPYMSFAS